MEMDGYKKRFDWASLILGIVLVVLGCVSIMHPDKSLHLLCILVGVGLLLLILVGVGLLLLGIYELWARSKMQEWLGYRSGWLLGTGILDIVLGIVFLVYQNFGTTVIAVIFALWFIISSANELTIAGFFHQLNVGYYWLLFILDILGLIIGVVLLFSPMLSAITMVWLISFYLIVIGIVKIIQAF